RFRSQGRAGDEPRHLLTPLLLPGTAEPSVANGLRPTPWPGSRRDRVVAAVLRVDTAPRGGARRESDSPARHPTGLSGRAGLPVVTAKIGRMWRSCPEGTSFRVRGAPGRARCLAAGVG